MINLLVGLQGAGKTYYAVAEIWKHIKKMHEAEISGSTYKYTKIYTNIEGFKPNKYLEILDMAKVSKIWEWELRQYLRYEKRYNYQMPDDIEFEVEKFDDEHEIKHKPKDILDTELQEERVSSPATNDIEIFDSNDLKLLQSIQDHESKLDPEFIQYTMPEFEKQGFTNCLFVIDEAHNFFGQGMGKELKRLLTYHRHYHGQDYLLISQDHKMFNFAVCQLAAYSIRAINPIMRWRSDMFTYKIYSGGWISFSGDNKLETKTLKAKEVVFNLYNSGGKVLAKSHFLKIILKVVGTAILLGVVGKIGLADYTHQDEVKVIKKEEPQQVQKIEPKKEEKPKEDEAKTQTEVFLIIGTNIIHEHTNKKFKFQSFERLLSDADKPISYDKNLDGTIKVYYELTHDTLIKIGLKAKNEKSSNFFTNDM
ncbi:MAG: hypothetical protein JXQ66_04785 [Campylobacterales bacterium]|nr:hypothetical protein [Campylobacterales bacterium]